MKNFNFEATFVESKNTCPTFEEYTAILTIGNPKQSQICFPTSHEDLAPWFTLVKIQIVIDSKTCHKSITMVMACIAYRFATIQS